jgi:dienelactone hydrolase
MKKQLPFRSILIVVFAISLGIASADETSGSPEPAEGAVQGQQTEIARYDVFEAVLTGSRAYVNPFLEVTVTATFTAPSGRKLRVFGFYDGGTTWRLRVAPDEVGQWRYVTQASDAANSGLDRQTGTFKCVPSRNKGFIRADAKHKYYFSYSDGTPFFALGDTCSVTCKALSDANRKAYLDARASKPFNFLRIFASLTFNAWTARPWSEAISRDADGFPWGGTPQSPDYDRLNPAYFQRYERILGELKQRNVHAEIIVFNLYEVPFKDPAIWTPERERLWGRYVVSRLSVYSTVFLWTVTQEYERYPAGRYSYEPADDDWVKRMAKLIRETDPYDHPITVHPWGKDPQDREDLMESGVIGKRFGRGPELDTISHQHNSYGTATWVPSPAPGYWDGPGAGVDKAIWADRKYDKPVINTEYGYEWLKGGDVNFNRQIHGTDKCRRAAWRIFTAGGAGLAAGFCGTTMGMDKADIYHDNKQRFTQFQIADSGHVRQLQYLYNFVTMRTGFSDMNPAQALVNAPNLCLANPGLEYIVYAPDGGELKLDLTAATGSFSVGWLNPRTGAYEGRAWVQGGAKQVFASPGSIEGVPRVEGVPPSNRGQDARATEDWVLHLKKVDDRSRADWQERLKRAARSPESWRSRREEIRQQILVAAGLWPEFERPLVKAVVTGQLERDGYTLKKVYLETWPGFYLTGDLYLPKKPGPLPAVLCTHGHGRNGRFGPDEEQPRAITLTRMGFVVFAYDMIGYGECTQLPHEFADPPWGLSLLGLQLWDSLRVVDFVSSLPEVDPKRIGVTGSSGGGTQTFLLTAVDDRIACAVPVCMVAAEFQGGCSCENAPGLRIGLNNVEIAAAAAPRPLMLVAATGDWTRYIPVLEGPAIHGVYKALGVDDRFRCVQFVAPHNYNKDSREAVYPWLAHWLGHAPKAENLSEPALEVEPHENLEVFTTAHPRPEDALDANGLDALLKEKICQQLDALWPQDSAPLKRFRQMMTPALSHTLSAKWPAPDGIEEATTEGAANFKSFSHISIHNRDLVTSIELLASASAGEKRNASLLVAFTAQDVESVLRRLRPDGQAVFVLRLQPHEHETAVSRASGPRSEGETPSVRRGQDGLDTGTDEQRRQFVSTYYRTALAWQVQDVLTALAYLTERAGFNEVQLAGLGEAGIATILSRALEPTGKVSLTIADLAGVDGQDERTWTGAREQAGMLRIGGLRTAAILAAPGELILHNTGARFDADAIRVAYRAAGRASILEISESPWSLGMIIEKLRNP